MIRFPILVRRLLKLRNVISQLPEYGAAETTSENGMYLGGKAQVLLKQIDFQYLDGSEGSAFIVTNVGSLIPEVKNLFVEIIVCIFLVLVIYRLCTDYLDLQKCHGTGRKDAGGNKV